MATALIAALASTSFTANADGTWYLGSYGVNLTESTLWGATEWSTSGNTGPKLTVTTEASLSSVVLDGLALTQTATTENNYLNLTDATGLNVLEFTSSAEATLASAGIKITTGDLDFTQVKKDVTGLNSLAEMSVLTVSGTSLTVNSNGEVYVEVQTSGGVALTGLDVGGTTTTWNGKNKETYIVTSDLGATALSVSTTATHAGNVILSATSSGTSPAVGLDLQGSDTYSGTFQATAESTGADVPTGANLPGVATAVSVTGENAVGTWNKGFSATATAGGLSPTATALLVGSDASKDNPITIGGGQISLTANLTTAKPNAEITGTSEDGFTATAINYQGSVAASGSDGKGGLISGYVAATEGPQAKPAQNYAVSIASTLNFTNAGDLVQNSAAVDATATGILMNGEGSLSVIAGAVAEGNNITAAVKANGGALTNGTSANAYAINAQQGTLTVSLAPETLAAGTSSTAVLDITATNNASFATAGTQTANAVAVYAQGGDDAAGTITINANKGTINISATAGGGLGSNAYGILADAASTKTNGGTVNLAGNTITVAASDGEENQVFRTVGTTYGSAANTDPYALLTGTDDGGIQISNAAIFANGAKAGAATIAINSAAENLTVTGDVVALSDTSVTSSTVTFTGYDADSANNTVTTITGNVYALNGGAVEIGDSENTTAATTDAVTVTGDTFIVGKATSSSTLTVNYGATYTAQGLTVVANDGALVVDGGKYIAQDVTVSAAAASSTAIITVGKEAAAGSTMTANGVTTLTKGGALNIGTSTDKVGTYNAYGNMVIGDAPAADAKAAPSASNVTLANADSTLNIGNASNNVTALVNLGGSIAGTAGTVNVAEGSTLQLVTTPTALAQLITTQRIGQNITSSIAGTVQILGSNLPAATETEANPTPVYYSGGLGKMTVTDGGSVIGDEGGLYLGLIGGDTLAFNGGSMVANSVNVGISGTGDATLSIGEDGNVEMQGNLIVGAASGANGIVNLANGTLTLADPTPADDPDGDPTSSLTINTTGTFNLSGEGTLVTNSQNLWKQAANEVIDADNPLQNNIVGGKTITATGGFLELTDAGVEASWLQGAQKTEGNVVFGTGVPTFIITGQLLQAGKNVGSILPTVPPNSKVKDNTLGYTGLMPNGGILSSTVLNATTQSFTSTDGKTTTTYQNLVIGGDQTTKTPWTQPTGTVLWNINPNAASDGVAGFSSVQLGDNGNILITGGDTLVLTGTGPTNEIVSGTGELNIYVGYQNAEGTLILGGDENIAKGGTFNGDITVNNGGLEVQYGEYTVNGTVTLGVAKSGSSATATATTATPGSIEVANGTLKVQSIAGNNVASIAVIGGTLNAGELNATMIHDDGQTEFEVVKEGNLIVGQDLTIKAANPTTTGPVGLSVSESDVQVGGALSATDTNIALTASSLTVTGDLTQGASRTTQASGLSFVLDNQGEVASTVKVGGNLSTTATTVSIEQSVVEVTGDLSITGQLNGTNTTPTTNLTLDEAQITAANINLANVNSVASSADVPYQSADITTGAMSLANSGIEVDDGKLTVDVLSVNPTSTLTLGMAQDTFDEIAESDQPDGLVVEASINQVNKLAGKLIVQGIAPVAGGQTEVAIGQFSFDPAATTKNPANVVLQGAAALILGSNSVEDFDKTAMQDPVTKAAAPEITTYLVAGQTVQLGLYNGIATGTEVTQPQNSGVSIGAGTGVIINPELLAKNGAVYGEAGNRQADLFVFDTAQLQDGQTAPGITIDQDAMLAVGRPLGNLTINLYKGLDAEGLTLSTEQLVQPDNPLYRAQVQGKLVEGSDPAQYENPVITVSIIPEQVSGQPDSVNSLGTNTILDAANMGYGVSTGADKILDLLSIATYANKETAYAQIRNQINQWALQGAAAHAHEIGISAASMVVDSVWDHSSKLAAAPHEEAKGDVWITLDWNHSRANDYKAGGLDNGYKLDLYGATFGADYDFANGLAAGLAVSVGGGEAKSKGINAGQKTDVTYWGINLYGTYSSPIVNVIGNVGYIGIKNKTKVGGDKGRPDANIWTIGVKAEKDFAINEQFTVTPHVGVRYLSVDVDDFNLGGFHYGTDKANLVQFPIGVAFAANLKTANGASVKPFLDLSFVPTAGDKKVDNTFGIQGGTMSDTIDTTIASTAMFQGKIGVNASYGAHNFGLNFAIGGGNKGRLDTGLQAKYRFVF